MTKILDILNELESTSSRKDKESILESHKTNPLLQRVLSITMDPRLNFYIKKIDQVDTSVLDDEDDDQLTLSEGLDFIVNELSTRKMTGNTARSALNLTMESMRKDDREVLRRVLLRDLRCGVKVPTVNKIFGEDFIHVHPVMLCEAFSAAGIERIFEENDEVIVQLKADGARASIAVHKDKVIVQTRSGEILDLNGRFDFLTSICPGFVIDGELLTRKNGKIESRKVSNGIMNSIGHGTADPADVARVFMKAWDIIPLETWESKKKGDQKYIDRLQSLKDVLSNIADKSIELIEYHFVKTIEEANEICDAWMASGEEGAIVKSPNQLWENKRSKDAIKIKAERTGEFRVVGFEYGREGKQFEGMLGALIVATDDEEVLSNVGGGFSVDQRKNWLGYGSPEAMMEANLIVELKFNEVIRSRARATYALFLPRFLVVRYDKSTTNTLEELKAPPKGQ